MSVGLLYCNWKYAYITIKQLTFYQYQKCHSNVTIEKYFECSIMEAR